MPFSKQTVDDIEVAGKRVLLRVDLNVPLSPEGGAIGDDSRIRAALPTINYLRDRGGRIVVCTHLGRPQGQVVDGLRMKPVRTRLAELLCADVHDAAGPAGPRPPETVAHLERGQVAMLENLRFDPREEANDLGFCEELAALADLYVNDAFGAAHRAHASTVGVAALLPAVGGLLLAREVEMLGLALDSPHHPVLAVIGGAKVSDKISVLTNLARSVDLILIGGGMVAAFLRAQELGGGAAVLAPGDVLAAKELLGSVQPLVVCPVDVVTAATFSQDAGPEIVPVERVPDDRLILDIGPATRKMYADEIGRGRTIVWNGPMGVAEWPQFAEGTHAVARAIAAARDAVTVVGGGSTAEAVGALGLRDRMTYVSTGGGASLEFLEGRALPGIVALMDRDAAS